MPSQRLRNGWTPSARRVPARAGAYAGLIPADLQAEDFARLARFLGSGEARHVNGAVVAADGGWTAA